MNWLRRTAALGITILFTAGQALDCGTLHLLGKGELGATPNWLIPYCTGTAERLEAQFKSSYAKTQFIQVYEVILNGGNLTSLRQSLNQVMAKAGYKYVSQTSRSGVVNLNYANVSKRFGYAVFVGPKELDYYFVLIKTKL